jgi:hypothetical protein
MLPAPPNARRDAIDRGRLRATGSDSKPAREVPPGAQRGAIRLASEGRENGADCTERAEHGPKGRRKSITTNSPQQGETTPVRIAMHRIALRCIDKKGK